jgi:hypothetical protein
MAIPSKQIGWGTESNLLWQIAKQIQYLTKVASTSISSFISQTITSGVIDKAPSENAVYNALSFKQGFGKIKLTDPNGAYFTDLSSAKAYVQQFTSATIFDGSFNVNGNEYFFSVAANTAFNNIDGFCNVYNMNFQDPEGLVIQFGADCFPSNSTDNIFGNISVNQNFLVSSTGNNIIGNITAGERFLYSSIGNNVMGSVIATNDFLRNSTGNNTIKSIDTRGYSYSLYDATGNNIIGRVDGDDYFLFASTGNNIIGSIDVGGDCLSGSSGNNTMNNVIATGNFLKLSTGNNTINGVLNVGDDAFVDAAPTIRNSIYKIQSCENQFALQYAGRMDVYVWGDTLGQDLPIDIFTTTNETWILIKWYYKSNFDLDVDQARNNIQAGNPNSTILYNL